MSSNEFLFQRWSVSWPLRLALTRCLVDPATAEVHAATCVLVLPALFPADVQVDCELDDAFATVLIGERRR